ncbi:MAG: DinB family protein [Anaerolineae bacterium]
MLATIDRQTAIQQLNIEHAAVRELINTLTPEEMTYPDTIRYGLYWDQKLSFKDLLAHLITYEVYSVEAVKAWSQGQSHPVTNAMLSESGGRAIHYGGIEDRRHLSLEEVLAEWERSQSELMTTIHRLTDADWHARAPYPTDVSTDLGGILEIILVAPPRPPYRHLPVHIPDTQVYIASLRRK